MHARFTGLNLLYIPHYHCCEYVKFQCKNTSQYELCVCDGKLTSCVTFSIPGSTYPTLMQCAHYISAPPFDR